MKNRCKENPCCGDPHSCTLNTRPTAPVEGLETVETQWRCTFIPNDKWVSSRQPDNMREGAIETRELVTRSQAEEILARNISKLSRKIIDLEADNAALTARINGFEGFLDDLVEILGCERDIGDVVNELDAINNRAEALETQLAAAKKALEFISGIGFVAAKDAPAHHDEDVKVARAALEDRP